MVATSVKMQALISHIHHYITKATLCFIFNHQFTQQHVQTSDYKGKRNEASRVSSYPRGYNGNGTKKNEVSCGSTVFFSASVFCSTFWSEPGVFQAMYLFLHVIALYIIWSFLPFIFIEKIIFSTREFFINNFFS